MNKKKFLLAIAELSAISFLINMAALFLNSWLLSSGKSYSPTEALFIEGIIFLFLGLLLLLGRGGINLLSIQAIMLSALAGFLYDEDTVGPSEVFRQDRWKPHGFVRLALVLMMAGVFMILTYFINTAMPF